MTFEQAIEKYLDKHGDFGTAMHFGQTMYEAGKAARRRPLAIVRGCVVGRWMVFDGVSGSLLRGGFENHEEAKEWARSNGYEVC